MYTKSGFKKNNSDAFEAKTSTHNLDSTHFKLLEQEKSRQTTFQMHPCHFWILEKPKLMPPQSLSETALAGTEVSGMIAACLLTQVLSSVLLSQTGLNSHICSLEFFDSNLINYSFFCFPFFLTIFCCCYFFHSREQSLSLSRSRRTERLQRPGNE